MITLDQLPDADPATLTVEQAKLAFQEFVKKLQREGTPDFTTAWALARGLKPALAARAFAAGNLESPPEKVRLVGAHADSAQLIPQPARMQPGAAAAGSGRKLSIALPNEGKLANSGGVADGVVQVPFDEAQRAFSGIVACLIADGLDATSAQREAARLLPTIATARANQTES